MKRYNRHQKYYSKNTLFLAFTDTTQAYGSLYKEKPSGGTEDSRDHARLALPAALILANVLQRYLSQLPPSESTLQLPWERLANEPVFRPPTLPELRLAYCKLSGSFAQLNNTDNADIEAQRLLWASEHANQYVKLLTAYLEALPAMNQAA